MRRCASAAYIASTRHRDLWRHLVQREDRSQRPVRFREASLVLQLLRLGVPPRELVATFRPPQNAWMVLRLMGQAGSCVLNFPAAPRLRKYPVGLRTRFDSKGMRKKARAQEALS